jgi:hypothetical protein
MALSNSGRTGALGAPQRTTSHGWDMLPFSLFIEAHEVSSLSNTHHPFTYAGVKVEHTTRTAPMHPSV